MICMRLYKFCNTKNQHQKHQHFYVSNCTNTALLKIMAQKHDSVLSTSSLLQRKNYYGYYHLYLFIVICYVSFFIYATEIIWITDIIKVVIISVSPSCISKGIEKDNLQTEVPQCQMFPKYNSISTKNYQSIVNYLNRHCYDISIPWISSQTSVFKICA